MAIDEAQDKLVILKITASHFKYTIFFFPFAGIDEDVIGRAAFALRADNRVDVIIRAGFAQVVNQDNGDVADVPPSFESVPTNP